MVTRTIHEAVGMRHVRARERSRAAETLRTFWRDLRRGFGQWPARRWKM